jgi:small GTP-binding protein
MRIFKLVIAGDGAVGKTTLVKVFCDQPFLDQIMTIGMDLHIKDVTFDHEPQTLQIWDLSGQTQFKFLLKDFARATNGAILAFDVSRESSFQSLDSWLEILRADKPDLPVVLIATKRDLNYDPSLNPERAKEYARNNDLIDFIETSSKEYLNIEVPFRRLLETINKVESDSVPVEFKYAKEKPKFIDHIG